MKKIDTSKAKWELTKGEKYAIRWFEEHGFEGRPDRQYLSKTYFTVSKDGVSDVFSLPMGSKGIDYPAIMEQYDRSFKLLCELEELRRRGRGE